MFRLAGRLKQTYDSLDPHEYRSINYGFLHFGFWPNPDNAPAMLEATLAVIVTRNDMLTHGPIEIISAGIHVAGVQKAVFSLTFPGL